MGRGGKRDGAGGSRKLGEEDELWVGSWCEEFWQRLWYRQEQKAWARRDGRIKLVGPCKPIADRLDHRRQQLPAPPESAWSLLNSGMVETVENARKEAKRRAEKFQKEHRKVVKSFKEDFAADIQHILGGNPLSDDDLHNPVDQNEVGAYFVITRSKPQGVQSEIRRRARAMVLRRYGVSVSDQKVKDLWDEWRTLTNALGEAEYTPPF